MFFRLLSMLLLMLIPSLHAAESKLYRIPLKDIQGKDTSLEAFSGKVILAVNVASKCGKTPQYAGLQELYEKYEDQGLVMIGFPCNDFGGQEPGTNEEIQEFCSTQYRVTFPLMDKVHVKGPNQHPLYAELTGPDAAFPGDIKWNFGKFLISREGKVIARFESDTKPDSPELVQAVEAALAKK